MVHPLTKRKEAVELSKKGFTQQEISEKISVSRSTVYMWGKNKEPDFVVNYKTKGQDAAYPFLRHKLFIYVDKESGFGRVRLVNLDTNITTFTSYNRYIACVKEGRILEKDERVIFRKDHLVIKKNKIFVKKIPL